MTLRIGGFGGGLSGPEQAALQGPAPHSLESFVIQFPRELTRFSSLAGMAAGAGAFRLARYAALGLAGQGGLSVLGKGFGGRLFSATVGTMVEAPIFNGVVRAVEGLGKAHPASDRGDLLKEFAATATMLGSLRIFGFVGPGAWGLANRYLAGQIPSAFGAVGTSVALQMGGLHCAHQIQKNFGWIDPRISDPTASDHLASIAQFTGMGMLMRGVLGGRWAAMERALDQKMEWNFRPPQLPELNPWQPAWNGGGERSIHFPTKISEKSSNTVFSVGNFESPLGAWTPGVSNGPAVTTPKNIFPQTYPGEIKDTGNSIYLEFGSHRDLTADPKARDSMTEQSRLLKSLFSPHMEVKPSFFSGISAQILTQYPGLLWGMKRNLGIAGHKLWIQIDADQRSLRTFLLLDGFDRPRHGLLTLPSGSEALEIKVNYYSSGFPQIQGTYFRLDPFEAPKLEVSQIRRVKFDEVWEEGLENPQVQLGLFKKGSFAISLFHQREIPVTIRYTIGDRKSQWDWNALPEPNPMLHLETRYEEYHRPSAIALRKARALTRNTPTPEPVLATQVDPPIPAPVVPEPRVVAAVRFSGRPQPPAEAFPSNGGILDSVQFHLKRLQDGGDGKTRNATRTLRALYYEVSTTDQLRLIHPSIVDAIPFLLSIPVHGPSFVMHYSRMASAAFRMEILQKVQTQLSSQIPVTTAGAFEVIQKFSPRLEGWERKQLFDEMEQLHGKSPQWRRTLSMVYQGRRALEAPPPHEKMTRPTFL